MSRKKGKYKQKVGFSIDKNNIEILDKYCNDNYINKSQLVNSLISDFVEKIKNNYVKTNYMEH